MEGFKSNPKMRSDIACYKEGGSVGYKSRHSEKTEMKEDVAQDKAIVKKGVAQHEAAKHKGEPKTELKLKTGGRCKKEGGTVRKYKTGGEVKKPIAMKKDAADKKAIAKTKASAAAPKKKAPKTEEMTIETLEVGELPAFQGGGIASSVGNVLKGGVNVGNSQGSMTDLDRKLADLENRRKMGRAKTAMTSGLTPSQQAQFAGQELAGQGAVSDAERQILQRSLGQGQGQMSDTDSIMEGLKQLGKFASGGGVY